MLVNGRNILDACWLVAHDARISLGVEKVKRKQLQRTGSQVYAEDMQRYADVACPCGHLCRATQLLHNFCISPWVYAVYRAGPKPTFAYMQKFKFSLALSFCISSAQLSRLC